MIMMHMCGSSQWLGKHMKDIRASNIDVRLEAKSQASEKKPV